MQVGALMKTLDYNEIATWDYAACFSFLKASEKTQRLVHNWPDGAKASHVKTQVCTRLRHLIACTQSSKEASDFETLAFNVLSQQIQIINQVVPNAHLPPLNLSNPNAFQNSLDNLFTWSENLKIAILQARVAGSNNQLPSGAPPSGSDRPSPIVD